MFDTRATRADFSHAAAHYDANALLQHKVRARLLEKMTPYISAPGTVLDAGCGTGKLAGSLPMHDIVALDLAWGMCEQAALHGIKTVCAPVNNLPFADARFDVVFSSLVLQWIEDMDTALNEMRRVLKPSGVLAVSYLCEGSLHELKESFAVCDTYPHISDFPAALPQAELETITEYYPDMVALMHHLKTIGARNKHSLRRKSVMTPRQLAKAEHYYRQHFSAPEGIGATWQVQYYVEQAA